MKYRGDKVNHYCEACRTLRRIVRCRACYGRGDACYLCDRSGYQCEEAEGDPKHRWKKSWE
ncbi:MAG TPA: hypothetical protein VIL36_13300 [Acidimicrobiales bacterium]